ncbi:hypothetical protein [Marinoscillum sp. 108]|uniref:hypothetical protein n=1 Tax=Marinoscillum sp. 108 TaxID=2653151 RepID=UPI0012F3F129|nr:hypothetical protein [Marinoscillum sp. 108]VXD10925.1 conserved hypothetical protein [Marinoscillum sp. 108]
MKKILMHGIYIVIIAFFVVFANIKASEAQKSVQTAEEALSKVEVAQADAVKQAKISEDLATEKIKALYSAQKIKDELEACKGKK